MDQYGSVNLGMSILEGKTRPDPRNQELNLGRQPIYGKEPDLEPRKQNVYMGQRESEGAGPQEPKMYYDHKNREKKDSIRRKILDQKISFMEGRQKNTENRNAFNSYHQPG